MVVRLHLPTIQAFACRVDNSQVLSQESQAEKRALQEQLANTLDLQGVLEQHYAAKVPARLARSSHELRADRPGGLDSVCLAGANSPCGPIS